MADIIYKRAESNQELFQILELQRANIPSVISEVEKEKEGFVTVHHTFEILKAMNDRCAHIIASSNDRVVGYALCMVPEFKEDIEVLKPMFKKIENNLEANIKYIVMGQVCIDKLFRKQSIFRGLYNTMREELKHQYSCIVTEVDKKNTRSLNAHYAIGFKTLYSYRSNRQDWDIIFWKLN